MRRIVLTVMKLVQILTLLIILFSYAMFQGGFVSWFLFYAVLPFLLYYLVFLFYPMGDWQAKRILPQGSIKAGQTANIQLELSRRLVLPIPYLIIEEHAPKSLDVHFYQRDWARLLSDPNYLNRKRVIKKMVFPHIEKRITLDYSLDHLPRGEHQLDQIELTITDWFGVITKKTTLSVQSVLAVEPADLPIQIQWANHWQQVGEKSTTPLQSQQSNIVTGIREYVPGDRISSINWKATARTGTFMTKEYDQEQHFDGMVLLGGSEPNIAFEWNLAVARMLIFVLKQSGHTVEFSYLNKADHWLGGQANEKKLVKLFTSLSTDQANSDFAYGLHIDQLKLAKASFIVLFTNQLTEASLEQLRLLSHQVKRIQLYWTKAIDQHTEQDKIYLRSLRSYNIDTHTITEHELKSGQWVVSI